MFFLCHTQGAVKVCDEYGENITAAEYLQKPYPAPQGLAVYVKSTRPGSDTVSIERQEPFPTGKQKFKADTQVSLSLFRAIEKPVPLFTPETCGEVDQSFKICKYKCYRKTGQNFGNAWLGNVSSEKISVVYQ